MKRGSHVTLSEIDFHVTKIVEPTVIPWLYITGGYEYRLGPKYFKKYWPWDG